MIAAAGWRVFTGGNCVAAVAFAALLHAAPGRVADTAGQLAERTMAVPEFSQLLIDLPADISIRQSDRSRVLIRGEDRVLSRIALVGNRGVLHIHAEMPFSTRLPLQVEVEVRQLQSLQVRGVGNVALKSLRGDALNVTVVGAADLALNGLNLSVLRLDSSGSGKVSIAGQALSQEVDLHGSTSLEAGNFRTDRTKILVRGAAEAVVWATASLEAEVEGAGVVRYVGSPGIRQQVSGSGVIEQAEVGDWRMR